MEKFVIAIKPVNTDTYQYAFVEENNFENGVGVGFNDANKNTLEFDTLADAERWWKIMRKYLVGVINKCYNEDSLCIQKNVVVIKTENVKKLSL